MEGATKMKLQIHKVFNRCERVGDAMGWAGAYIMLTLIVFVFFSVVMRYIVNKPLEFSDEIAGYLQVSVVFIGLAYALKEGAHINTEVFVRWLPKAVREKLNLPIHIFGSAFTLAFAYSMCRLVVKDFTTGAKSFTTLETPLWIPESVAAIGTVIFFLQMIIQLGKILTQDIFKEDL